MAMRGQEDTYGMGAGASVRKGNVKKQVSKARKNINAASKKSTTVNATSSNRNNNTLSKKDSNMPKEKRPNSMADKIGKPKATAPKSVTGPRTTIGAKSFTTKYTKSTPRQKAMKANPRGGY